jgi:branched-chain amino acid transport system permease protein
VPKGRAVGLTATLFLIIAIFLGSNAWAAGETIEGRVQGDGEPVAGARVTVTTETGAAVGKPVTSAADGSFTIKLPGPGTYTVTLDIASVPPAFKLPAGTSSSRSVVVRTGGSRPVLFALTSGKKAAGSKISRPLQLFAEGIRFGLVIAMASVGLSLIFGTTGLTNFAHGEMVTFGAVAAWYFNVSFGLNLILAAMLAMVAGGAVGALQELALWRPLRRRGTGLIAMLVISIGLSLFAKNLILYFFKGRTRPYAQYSIQRGLDLGPISLAPRDLAVIVLSIVVLALVGLVLQRTRVGTATRAVADNRDLAASSGINVERVILAVWVAGGALAALGGVFSALTSQVGVELGSNLLLLMFAGVTLGGLGTAYGALLGSVLIGILIQMSTLVIAPELKNAAALLLLILILLVRPQGLLGRRERVG